MWCSRSHCPLKLARETLNPKNETMNIESQTLKNDVSSCVLGWVMGLRITSPQEPIEHLPCKGRLLALEPSSTAIFADASN